MWEYPKVKKEDYGVHETHCCIIHGCKYGNHENCPVCKGLVKQQYLCETCSDEHYWNKEKYIDAEQKTWDKIDKEYQRRSRELKLKRITDV